MTLLERPPADQRRVFTDREVADLLSVDVTTIQRLCRRGTLGHVRVGNRYRITASQLDAYLAGEKAS